MHDNLYKSKILILDFGSQYTKLIARVIRELHVYCEIWPFDVSSEKIKEFNPAGIILSGGHKSVLDTNPAKAPDIIFDLNCPILGICYGMQTLVTQLGGKVEAGKIREFGRAIVSKNSDSTDTLTQGFFAKYPEQTAWMSHGDHVTELPKGFKTSAKTNQIPNAAIYNLDKNYYGIQFHPEVTHTPNGRDIYSAFLFDICKCEANWQTKQIAEHLIEQMQEQVGEDSVLLGLSGGVDSSVVAALLQQAIGKQLHCVFVDTGLLRINEADTVKHVFKEKMDIDLHIVDAKDIFYEKLKGVTDPEKKRKIIGHLFIEQFDAKSKELTKGLDKSIKFLAQGTIYPDVIESAVSSKAQTIKSHHNVGGLPEELNFELLEPLRELFKDEVRQLGAELGLAEQIVGRHPFPGPGLAVRILGEIKAEFIPILQKADHIFMETLHKHDWYNKVSQAFAVFLPVKSVGVVGDSRQYEYVIALRAVQTTDFMTAHWAELPYALLDEVSHRIVNEVKGVSRVTYDITGKPPATIEWE
jgi:GMP synthase (glutamine-hydrolysing)